MLQTGDIIDGKYRVVRLIGEGGMGAVYEGRNVRLDRPIAIKVMLGTLALDTDAVTRFEREAQAAARIGSRHIVDILDLGELETGDRYMVMEFLKGHSLAARLKSVGRLPVPAVADLGIQLLEGLSRVHDAGIVHRDLKPANVFLARDDGGADFVKILDFGVCKIPKDAVADELGTGVGDLLGTPSYMSPEQLEHGPSAVDARSDLYAVGVLLYRSVAGRLPYKAKDLGELLVALRQQKNPPLAEVVPDVDPDFAAIIDHAVEWDPAARYQTARDFGRALVEFTKKATRLNALLAEFLDVDDSPSPFEEPREVELLPEDRETARPPNPMELEALPQLEEVHDEDPPMELEEVHDDPPPPLRLEEVRVADRFDPRAERESIPAFSLDELEPVVEVFHQPDPVDLPPALPELDLAPLDMEEPAPLERPTPVVAAPVDELEAAEVPPVHAPAAPPVPRALPPVAGKRPMLRKKGAAAPPKDLAAPPKPVQALATKALEEKATVQPPAAKATVEKPNLPAPPKLPALRPPPRRAAATTPPDEKKIASEQSETRSRKSSRPPTKDEGSHARRQRKSDAGIGRSTSEEKPTGGRR